MKLEIIDPEIAEGGTDVKGEQVAAFLEELMNLNETEAKDRLASEKNYQTLKRAVDELDSRIKNIPKGDPKRMELGKLKRMINDKRKKVRGVDRTMEYHRGVVVRKKKDFNV